MAGEQEVLTLLPPEPASTENEFIENGDFVKGQFDYIKRSYAKTRNI